MKRYTVYDASLGRYVVPLSKGSGPTVGICDIPIAPCGVPQTLLFGEVVDHLAQLEIAAEEAEQRRREDGA